MQHWLLKSEPSVWSGDIQSSNKNGGASWTGVSIQRMQDTANPFDMLVVVIVSAVRLGELKTPFIFQDVKPVNQPVSIQHVA